MNILCFLDFNTAGNLSMKTFLAQNSLIQQLITKPRVKRKKEEIIHN